MVSERLGVSIYPADIYAIRRSLRLHYIICGIQFHSQSASLPLELNYSLIFPSNFESENPSNPYSDMHWRLRENTRAFHDKTIDPNDLDIYYREGFLQIQSAIYLAFMQLSYKVKNPNEVYMYHDFPVNLKQIPYRIKGERCERIPNMEEWVETMVFFSYVLPTIFMTKVILTRFFYKILYINF